MKHIPSNWWPMTWQQYTTYLKGSGMSMNQLRESYMRQQQYYEALLLNNIQNSIGGSKVSTNIDESDYVDDYVDDYVE